MAAHSSILAWRVSWMEEPGTLQSMGLQRVGHDSATNTYLLTYTYNKRVTDYNLHMCVCMLSHLSHVQLSVILWMVTCQASLSMEFSRQEDWNGLPRPPPGDLPNTGIKPLSPTVLVIQTLHNWTTGKALNLCK